MDRSILRALAAEVHRRTCPGCGRSLSDAGITARFSSRERVQLSFKCSRCGFEGGGEITITPDLLAETREVPALPAPATTPAPEPISADELLTVHQVLAGWQGSLVGLLDRRLDPSS